MPASEDDLYALLEQLGIPHRTVRHEPLFTVEQSRDLRGTIPGAHTKNLFLKDKKGRVFLISAEEDTPIDLKALHRHLDCGRLSFGSAELMQELIGVTPGSVTALAVMNDHDRRVTLVLDQNLMSADQINAHPLTNTATTTLARDDLLRFLEAVGHKPLILDLPAPPEQAD